MAKIKYNENDIKKLNSNNNVVMVKYGRQIEYKDFFKKWAVVQSEKHPEMSANQIFEMAGFDINLIGKRTADSRIRSWKSNYYKSCNNIKDIKEDYSEKNYCLLVNLYKRFSELIDILK